MNKRNVPCCGDLESVLDMVVEEIECLKDEMEEQRSSMEDNQMEHLPRYEVLDATVNSLEEAEQSAESAKCEVGDNEHISGLEVNYTEDQRKAAQFRPGRRDNIARKLCSIVEAIDEAIDQGKIGDHKLTEDESSVLDSIRNDCEESQNAVEEAEFPGMFG